MLLRMGELGGVTTLLFCYDIKIIFVLLAHLTRWAILSIIILTIYLWSLVHINKSLIPLLYSVLA